MGDDRQVPRLGPRLESERKKRRLTLEGLAALSGVSRSMLSQIERGEANPTFGVLWSLTQALGIELGTLVSGAGLSRDPTRIDVMTHSLTPEIRDPDGAWVLRILGAPALVPRMEWYLLELAPGGVLASAAHAKGTVEHLTVLSGKLTVKTTTKPQPISSGDTARYSADVPHEITNATRKPASALMVVICDH